MACQANANNNAKKRTELTLCMFYAYRMSRKIKDDILIKGCEIHVVWLLLNIILENKDRFIQKERFVIHDREIWYNVLILLYGLFEILGG